MKNSVRSYLSRHKLLFLLILLINVIFIFYFWLFNYSLNDLVYIIILSIFITLAIVIIDYYYYHKEYMAIKYTSQSVMNTLDLIEPEKLDSNYVYLVNILIQELASNQKYNNDLIEDIKEYYSLWIHQIKVPISAIDFTLQNSNHPATMPISNELVKINQYVEMALNYLKLESSNSDIYITTINLDKVIKATLHKLSSLFIQKKLTLKYNTINESVLSDEKWLGFIIEQLLSNAIKYTNTGTITISYSKPYLTIADTGIGIEASDLPRIYERGYTGFNGRIEQHSSGIGLYLTKKTAEMLNHPLSINSTLNIGTNVTIDLSNKKRYLD